MKSKKEPPSPGRGGKRQGAGRPSLGKSKFCLSLNPDNVERAREKENNLSALLDRLLAQWLEKAA